MGIGPELPPHLQPRQRSPSPPPQAGPSIAGPRLPPHLARQLDHQTRSPVVSPQPSQESDDDYTPSLPPDLAAARSTAPVAGPTMPPPGAVLGPAKPPQAGLSRRRRETPLSAAYSDASDDDGFGPMPLPAGADYDEGESAGARLFREREEREKEKERKKKENEGKLTRDEWMIVPPENMGLLACTPPPAQFATRAHR